MMMESWNDTRTCGNKPKDISSTYKINSWSQKPENQECLIIEDDVKRDFPWSKINLIGNPSIENKARVKSKGAKVFEYQEKHNRELREKDLKKEHKFETSVSTIDKQGIVKDDISSHGNYSLTNNVLTLEITDECSPLRSGQEITQGESCLLYTSPSPRDS